MARDVDAGTNLQIFLVSAVTAVLVTRLYLSLTGYPRIGSGPLHIAHLLWGGLLMLTAQIIVLSMLGKRAKRLAAIVGGLGLGLFIDEIGKFVTSDNNYFFQPAIALIYVLFVLLFLSFRAIEHRSFSPHEMLVNAADLVREVVSGRASRANLVRARRLLDLSCYEGAMVDGLREAISGAREAHEERSRLDRTAASAWRAYDRLLAWPWFPRAILVVFLGEAVVGLLWAAALGWVTMNGQEVPASGAELVTSLMSVALAVVGVARLRESRLDAYRWFERSVLISIFFTQVVMFWQDQLSALGGLIVDLVLLAGLRFLIHEESARTVTQH